MNKSVKAVLLSALILPGVGQLYLGYKKRGWSIITANIVLLYLIISEIMQRAYSIIEEMKKSGVAMDVQTISNKASDFSGDSFLNIILMLFIIGWFFSIVDAYRLGKN